MSHFSLYLIVASMVQVLVTGQTWAQANLGEAEVVFLNGQGQKRINAQEPWLPTVVKDRVRGGGYVQTLSNSQMGVMLPDRNQIRLNQNSQLQIKSIEESREWTQSTVRLNSGRAWSQARPMQMPDRAATPDKRVTMETPSATLSIRGTDWEVEVAPDGSVQLVVLSGSVRMENEQGGVTVGSGGAARAEKNQAPRTFELVNPRDRVQWVSGLRPTPETWLGPKIDERFQPAVMAIRSGRLSEALRLLSDLVGEGDPVAIALQADVLLSVGEINKAVSLLDQGSRLNEFPALAVLYGRALARQGRVAEARAFLLERSKAVAESSLLWIAVGELALIDGDLHAGRQAFETALLIDSESAAAWRGLGFIATEREDYPEARKYYEHSLNLSPDEVATQIELAHVAVMSGQFDVAEKRLRHALEREPANYVAYTILGSAYLRAGQLNDALSAFLRSSTIEPRYARNQLYLAVAFYQLGEVTRAVGALEEAKALDRNDPLPYLMLAQINNDDLNYAEAIENSRVAVEKIPFLKSLNPLVTDERGRGNVAGALAAFGLEDWASWNSRTLDSPFSAANNFFLADRTQGRFAKDSHQLLGFIVDPLVFGNPTGRSSLVSRPGHHASLTYSYARDEWRQNTVVGKLNGLFAGTAPVAYSLSIDRPWVASDKNYSKADGRYLTFALGVKPNTQLGLFSFFSDASLNGSVNTESLPDGGIQQTDRRSDTGLNYRFSPENQIWLKLGDSLQGINVQGDLVSPGIANTLQQIVGVPYDRRGKLERYSTTNSQRDFQFRHTLGWENYLISWGVESARQELGGEVMTVFGVLGLGFNGEVRAHSRDIFFQLQSRELGRQSLAWSAGIWQQNSDIQQSKSNYLTLRPQNRSFGFPAEYMVDRQDEWNPRLGALWRFSETGGVTLVGQRWRRPAARNSLSGVYTMGVPVNDNLVQTGGLYERVRLQLDLESSINQYFQAFLDRENIDNGVVGSDSVVPEAEVDTLDNLRNSKDFFTRPSEFEKQPIFPSGQIATLGMATNFLISSRYTQSVNYRYRYQSQTGNYGDLKIPFIPRHHVQLASHWLISAGWLMSLRADFRSSRFVDIDNHTELASGWKFGLGVYWQSNNKSNVIQGYLDNLLPKEQAGIYAKPSAGLRWEYRFGSFF